MSFWRKLFKKGIGQPSETPISADEAGTTLVVLPDEDMAFFKSHGGTLEMLDAAGRRYLGEGYFQEAFRCFRILSRIVPRAPDAWLDCGIALYEEDAVRHRALEGKSAPALPPLENMRAALPYFDATLELDQDNHLAWYYKASALTMIGRASRNADMLLDGLHCFDEALRTRPGDSATKEAIRIFRMSYGMLHASGKRRPTGAVCDVCSYPIEFAEGYCLTTEQVVLTVGYWVLTLKGPFRALLSNELEALKKFSEVILEQAAQVSGWLVCEPCSELFQFDRRVAKTSARRREDPPGAGSVRDTDKVLSVAFVARTIVMEGSA